MHGEKIASSFCFGFNCESRFQRGSCGIPRLCCLSNEDLVSDPGSGDADSLRAFAPQQQTEQYEPVERRAGNRGTGEQGRGRSHSRGCH
ncbi:hypothetical protein ACLKA6_002185 [Drosophila palustris]